MIKLEHYSRLIQSCNNFQDLDGAIYDILKYNMFEHLIPEIQSKIETLEISGPLDNFCQTMLWAVCFSNYSDSAMVLLKRFSQRAATAIKETLPKENITPTLLMIVHLCVDDPGAFNASLTEEQRTMLDQNLAMYEMPKENLPSGVEFTPKDYLQAICNHIWTRSITAQVNALAKDLSKYPEIHIGLTEIRCLLWMLIHHIKEASDKLRNIGAIDEKSVVYYPIGELMHNLARVASIQCIECGHMSFKGFGSMMTVANGLLTQYFPDSFVRRPIDALIRQYTEDDKFIDGWLEGDYPKAWKLYLDKDPCFQMHCDMISEDRFEMYPLADSEKLNRFTCAIRDYIGYIDPNKVTPATEASKKSEQWTYEEDEPTKDDNSEEEESSKPDYDIEATQSKKGYHKFSKTQHDGQNKIYRSFKNYNNNRQRVDSQLNKMFQAAKRAFTGDKTEEILSGHKWTPMKLLRKVIHTGAIYSFSKIGAFAYLVGGFYLDKRRTDRQRREIVMELDSEIKLLEEKIDDARGDGNRQAKYALMRTKAEVERARDRIRFNLNASQNDMNSAKDLITGRRFKRSGPVNGEEY